MSPRRSKCPGVAGWLVPVFSAPHPTRTLCCPDRTLRHQFLQQTSSKRHFKATGERSKTQLKRKNRKTVHLLPGSRAALHPGLNTHTNPQEPPSAPKFSTVAVFPQIHAFLLPLKFLHSWFWEKEPTAHVTSPSRQNIRQLSRGRSSLRHSVGNWSNVRNRDNL